MARAMALHDASGPASGGSLIQATVPRTRGVRCAAVVSVEQDHRARCLTCCDLHITHAG